MPRTLCGPGLSTLSALLLTSACFAQPPADTQIPSTEAPGVVYLQGPADIERLKTDNPTHYAQAKAIVAAADVICANGPGSVQYTAGTGAHCETMLLKTSNPPKRQISFTLGSTHYIALVVLTHAAPHPTPALATPR